ncbi:conserved hypothetical protein [delta proteobacterium NaphS2]|nr:conserved hypothetical protein [delta proteobacterium NaphS2]
MNPLFELLDDNLPPYCPEQVIFLKYRPVLSNRKLKEEFGYTPLKTSEEVFRFYLDHKKSKKTDHHEHPEISNNFPQN